MVFRLLPIAVLAVVVHSRSPSAPSPLLHKAPQSIAFLKKYGYLPGPSYTGQLDTRMPLLEELFTKDAVENAIKQAQRFGGLKETGVLDDDTLKSLFQAALGNFADVSKCALREFPSFRNWPNTLSQSEVERETEKAMGVWAKYGHLKFTRSYDPKDADITIGFYRRQHGDVNPFDGKGNVLAHAYFPVPYAGKGLAGDAHFDDDETWSVGQPGGRYAVDYTTVALHELGHSLGLSHSHEQGSVMNPYYKGTHSLGEDDIHAMYELYASQPMEYPGNEEDGRQDNREDERRKYDQHKREWEKRQEEEDRRRQEEEERRLRERERQEDEKKYEEEKRKYEEERRKHEEMLRQEAERRKMEEKRDEEIRKRLEEESKRQEEERRKWNEKVAEKKRKHEEAKRRQEEETSRAEYERNKYEEKRRREEINGGKGKDSTSKSGRYPDVSTFEGDFEAVDDHKQHDSTHRIPPKLGDRDVVSGQVPSTNNKTSENSACGGSFDTVSYLRGELFITKGTELWRLSRPGVVQKGYPTEVHTFFHLLPKEVETIDAMYQRDRDGSLIIFSGGLFWVFDGWKFIEGSPRSIEDYGLPKDVERVDAATSRNNEVLVFSGGRYWSFNDTTSVQLPRGEAYRPISGLGLPVSLDAVLTYKDVTYFFKGDRFWYQDQKMAFPILHQTSASLYWISC